jgi:ureidoglycolate hydrolase
MEGNVAQIVRIPVTPLEAEAFRPFGELLSTQARPADFVGVNSAGWKAGFDISGSPLVMVFRSPYEGFRFTKLERHFGITQTFIPLGHAPAVVAVAAPTDSNDPGAIPRPEDVRGFIVDGSVGYVLKRGTWHSLDRYPLVPPASEIVIITAHETQDELENVPRERRRLTHEIDYAAKYGIVFEFTL